MSRYFQSLPEYLAVTAANIKPIFLPASLSLWKRHSLLNRAVPEYCRAEGADALLCLGNFSPRRPPCPTVLFLQNAWFVYASLALKGRQTVRERVIHWYGRFCLRRLHAEVALIVQTEVMKDHLLRLRGISEERVAIIPNSFCSRIIAKSGPPPRFEEPREPFTFLYLTRYYPHKNLEILVDAFKRLPSYTSKSARCIITISSDQHPGARRLLRRIAAQRLDGVVDNIGPVPTQKLSEVYQSAEALIMPTLLESYSRTYLEAMHFGLPILTSDRDFASHLCRDAAVYFDPLDADSVARAMARIVEDRDLRVRLVQKGKRVLLQTPAWDEVAARFVEVLERAAVGKPVNAGYSEGDANASEPV